MELIEFTQSQFQLFLFILFRISGIFIISPIFGSRSIPYQIKISIALVFTVVLLPIVGITTDVDFPTSLMGYAVGITQELAVGLLIGFTAALIFAGIQLGGQIIGRQIGLALANVIDPMSNTQVSIIGQFKFFLAMLLFLLMDGHHWLLLALINSFKEIPLLSFELSNEVVEHIGDYLIGKIFIIAIKVGAPCFVALLLTTIAMGFLARAVPEMNIFIIGFSIRIGVGLGVLALSIPFFAYIFEILNDAAKEDLFRLIGMM